MGIVIAWEHPAGGLRYMNQDAGLYWERLCYQVLDIMTTNG